MADTPQQDRDLNLPRERQGGRFVTKYDPMIALVICERVAEGETLKAICVKKKGMPARQTFHRWVVNNPAVSRAYAAARELSGHALEEEALDLARELAGKTVPKEMVRGLDVAMNQLRWSAAKRNPSVYSERAAMHFTVPIQINTTIDLGGNANDSAPDHPDIYTIDAKIEVEPAVVEKYDTRAEMVREDAGDAPLADPPKPVPKPARFKRERNKYGVLNHE